MNPIPVDQICQYLTLNLKFMVSGEGGGLSFRDLESLLTDKSYLVSGLKSSSLQFIWSWEPQMFSCVNSSICRLINVIKIQKHVGNLQLIWSSFLKSVQNLLTCFNPGVKAKIELSVVLCLGLTVNNPGVVGQPLLRAYCSWHSVQYACTPIKRRLCLVCQHAV